jgi:hypothetical protein
VKDEGTVPVTVHLPRPLYGILAATARKHDANVGPLIVATLQLAINPNTKRRRRRTSGGRNFWTAADDRTLRRLHKSGMSGPQIAERMGRSNTTIMRHRQRLGLTPHFSGRPPKANS